MRPVGRRGFLRALSVAAATSIVPVFRPSSAHATFGEDVAVLLAQLEQQLQIVSNAIATVQNLVQTVQHLSNVVQNGKTLIKRATSKGGLKGIMGDLTDGEGGLQGVLNAANNVTGFAQSTISDLNVVGDLIWDERWATWQAGADLCRGKPEHECALAWSDRVEQASFALANADPMRVRSMKPLKKAFAGLKRIYDAHKEAMDAARDAQNEEGAVGVLQMISRQEAQAMTASTKAAEMAGISAQLQADEYGRTAAERERARAAHDAYWKDMEVKDEQPVDTGLNLSRSEWGQ